MKMKKKQPGFRIVKSGTCYYVFLVHGRRIINYYGKIVEQCSTNSGNQFTYIKLKFDRLVKLHLTKGVTFFGTMDNNKRFNLKEKDWFTPFQRAVLICAVKVDKTRLSPFSKTFDKKDK